MQADKLIPTQVTQTLPGHERRLTRRSRLPHVLALASAISIIPRAATAQPAYLPEAPASQAELETLRAELKQQAADNARRAAEQAAAIARLNQQIDAERAARMAEAQATREEAHAVTDQPLVRAGRFGLRLSGFVQVDAVAWSQDAQDQLNPATQLPLNDTRFNIKRARIRADIDYRMLSGAIEFDGNTTNGYQARIIGVEASLVWRNPHAPAVPYLELTAGSFKIPFGFEVQQRDTERLFLERSTTEKALFPGEYDLGVKLFGGWKFVRYSVAAMNGDPIGEKAFPGRDPNQSKDIIGKLGVDLIMKRLGIAGDFSALWGTGFHAGTPATKDVLVWRDLNQDGAVQLNEITDIPGQAALPSQNFQRWAVGGDVRVGIDLPRVGQLMLYGELYYATNLDRALLIADPVTATRDLRELGFYVAATQELTEWAQIGVRYDRYDPDRDANDLRGGVQIPKDGSYATTAVTVAGRYKGYGRLIAEYDHNTNALGRTTSGTITSLGSDQFILRAEVRF